MSTPYFGQAGNGDKKRNRSREGNHDSRKRAASKKTEVQGSYGITSASFERFLKTYNGDSNQCLGRDSPGKKEGCEDMFKRVPCALVLSNKNESGFIPVQGGEMIR